MNVDSANFSVHLNNELLPPKEVKKIFKSIQSKKILKAKGGFLFKSSINETEFHLGILPVIIEGERTHHYDIKLRFEDDCIFSGFFNTDGTLGILFTPPEKKENISNEFKEQLKIAYIHTAEVLIDNGFSGDMKLDWISRKILGEIGIFETVPICLGEFV